MDAEFAKYIAEAVKFIAAALCAISMKTAAEGVSKIWITMIDTVGRNPTVKNDVNAFGLIGFAATVKSFLVLFAATMAEMMFCGTLL